VPDSIDRRPPEATDDAVAAAGVMSEALEVIEEARGHLYAFHRLTGKADFKLDDAVWLLRKAGADDLAEEIERDLIGRNVITGRWTFQIVEDYDDGYYATFREMEHRARERLVAGRRHVAEAELKQQRRTPGRPGHEAGPEETAP
jgi:hypothetical protein